MKTIEEMRVAVLAELDRLCPQTGDKSKVEGTDVLRIDRHISGGEILQYTDRYRWEKVIDFNYRDHWREKCWQVAYRLLGLETSDAVEAEKSRQLKRYKARTNRLRANDAETYRIQIEVKDERIAALQARNTALVAALEKVGKTDLSDSTKTWKHGALAMRKIANEALAANTERGGVQG